MLLNRFPARKFRGQTIKMLRVFELSAYLFHEKLSIEKLIFIKDFIDNSKDEKSLGCYAPSDVVKEVGEKIKTLFAEVESKGQTQQLWIEYHRNVTIVKDNIRAEG